jgi:exonuclease 3'-5' domain-containing protein 1
MSSSSQQANSITVVSVASAGPLEQHVRKLLKERVLAIDLEGVDLGSPQSAIALIQICAQTQPEIVYHFHVRSIGECAFAPGRSALNLRTLLTSERSKKLFWDARADVRALRQEFDVEIPYDSILDLQLAEVAHRARNPKINVRYISGLRSVIEKVLHIQPSVSKDAAQSLFAPEKGGSYDVFFEYPLPDILRLYATDTIYFLKLFKYFKNTLSDFGDHIAAATRTRLALSATVVPGDTTIAAADQNLVSAVRMATTN